MVDVVAQLQALMPTFDSVQRPIVDDAISELSRLRPLQEQEAVAWGNELERLQMVSAEIDNPYLSDAVDALVWSLSRASPPVALPEGCVDEVETKLARASEALKRLDDVIDFSQPWEPASDACKCVQHCNGGAEAWNAALRHAREVRAMLAASSQAPTEERS